MRKLDTLKTRMNSAIKMVEELKAARASFENKLYEAWDEIDEQERIEAEEFERNAWEYDALRS